MPSLEERYSARGNGDPASGEAARLSRAATLYIRELQKMKIEARDPAHGNGASKIEEEARLLRAIEAYTQKLEEVKAEQEVQRLQKLVEKAHKELTERENAEARENLKMYIPLCSRLVFEKNVERDPIYHDDIPHR